MYQLREEASWEVENGDTGARNGVRIFYVQSSARNDIVNHSTLIKYFKKNLKNKFQKK